MQLANVKISNLLSFPYQPDFSKVEGVTFYNREHMDVHILIGPNGAGKSGFLSLIKQFFTIGLMGDYVYDKHYISSLSQNDLTKTIVHFPHQLTSLHPHFSTPTLPSHLSVQLILTAHDYDNLQYIVKHRDIINMIIKKYSTLDIVYPYFSHEDIYNFPSLLTLDSRFDFLTNQVIIDEKNLSSQQQFVVLYLKTLELVQICIDIYNEFERSGKALPLVPLKNSIAFIGMNRTLTHVPQSLDPHTWNTYIGSKAVQNHSQHVGYYLCIKKIRNIISDHFSLKMTKKNIANYPERLAASEFYTSLVYIIKKYINKTLVINYIDGFLTLVLVDYFGNEIAFAELSDGEQSLLSMIFTIYGYDLKEGLAFVDEPEIHFHPQMQRSFAKMIEKINQNIETQFIVSTYSPLFINESNIKNVYRFAKINGSTIIKTPLFSLSADESTLVHLLKFENLSKIFFVNKIIMVEGETDAYFFDFYLKYLHTLPERKDKVTDYEIININGKGSYKVRSKFLSRFGLQSFFVGDWDNVVDYGFMTQDDLVYYYKQAKIHANKLKAIPRSHSRYNKLVDTIKNLFPKQYRYLIAKIQDLYPKHVFILKKGDIETYLGMKEKGLEDTVKFCHHQFARRNQDKAFASARQEFGEIFSAIFGK